ncbi:folate transporter 2, putative [Plasmodium knowlesi strain H]|uniref:Folate transporter 2, putative n=3 Tax=Plasmodium knowlesi TaxID=5850 RepID=A0A5K1U4J3_PLAKH|nr:folate transporter 2, putative [Plasmodium knowlesi strain H]OTN64944.1 putative Folate transporter 2 [Plasmodium knowlesi]CAA9988189.1 folate transporter 2, putative [Plasmodium knowlesi strain H]SBO20106.1 folate transporter 2, putative [Plasmodium knowlesi strain H]SBO20674.1 folate transporter 2, putative [Plasmodium knowlesi strain H]VVS77663.1 folate transporter 2, putative [Plasmodium knowlesi strain H]|eukprot:XP_002259166.1 transmembrane protein, putative [Plasmodium knowlesi strain H]
MIEKSNNPFLSIDPIVDRGKAEGEEQPLINSKGKHHVDFTQIVVYLVGLSDGLTHLASLAIYYLFKDYFRLTPYQVSLILMYPYIPFILKPAIALITDSVSIFGMRRKPYLFLFSLFQSLNFLALAFLQLSVLEATLILFFISLCASFCTTVAEALVVESSIGKTYSQGTNKVTEFIASKAIGSLSVAYFSGYLLEKISREYIFMATSLFPLIISISCLFLKEKEYTSQKSILTQFKDLIKFVNTPIFLGPFLYIFIYMSGPDYDDAFFFFCTNKLGFRPSFMGTLRLTYGIASLIGIIIYRLFLKNQGLKKTLILTTLMSFPIYISPIVLTEKINTYFGISNELFVLSGGFLIEAITEIQLLPLFILTANICQPGLEASVFATILSVKNLGSLTKKGTSSFLTYLLRIDSYNFDNLSLYIFICGFFLLFSLTLVPLLPEEEKIDKLKNKQTQQLHA